MKFFGLPVVKLILALLSFAALCLSSACVKHQREGGSANQQTTRASPENQTADNPAATRININTASVQDLEKLPGIGRGFAQRIVEHRERYGAFRRPEHLIMVRGISDKRFRALRDLITVD